MQLIRCTRMLDAAVLAGMIVTNPLTGQEANLPECYSWERVVVDITESPIEKKYGTANACIASSVTAS